MRRGLGFMNDIDEETIYCNNSEAGRTSSMLQLFPRVQHALVSQSGVSHACFGQAKQSKRVGHDHASLELGPLLHRARGKIATGNSTVLVIRLRSLLSLRSSLHVGIDSVC